MIMWWKKIQRWNWGGDFSRRYERFPKVQLTEEQNTYLVKTVGKERRYS